MSTLFIGYTRFSVHQYESGSFNATRTAGGFTKDEYTDWLYDDDRLATRTAIFLQESLPQLEQASHDHDLVHIVTISPSLPQQYKQALHQARSQYRFLRIHETTRRAAPSHPNLSLVKTMLTKRSMEGKVFGMYRLDDDDLLPVDYFQRLGSYVTNEHVGYRVSLPQGIGAIRAQHGYVLPWSFYEAKSSAGFLTVHKFSRDGKKIYGLEARHHLKGHHKADRNFPVILDARTPGFFRARHRTQDSTLSAAEGPFFTRVIDQALTRPTASQSDINSAFPHVKSRIATSAEHLPGSQEILPAGTVLHHGGLPLRCDYQHPMLISGHIHGSAPTTEIQLIMTVDRVQGDLSETFFQEAGFSQGAEGVFSRAMHGEGQQITDVLEPAPGTRITGITLSSKAEFGIGPLHAAPLTVQGEQS